MRNRLRQAPVRLRECLSWSSRMKNYAASFVTWDVTLKHLVIRRPLLYHWLTSHQLPRIHRHWPALTSVCCCCWVSVLKIRDVADQAYIHMGIRQMQISCAKSVGFGCGFVMRSKLPAIIATAIQLSYIKLNSCKRTSREQLKWLSSFSKK